MDIYETINEFEKVIKPMEKDLSNLFDKKRSLENDLYELEKSIRGKRSTLEILKNDRIKWCQQNRQEIKDSIYPKKNVFYKIKHSMYGEEDKECLFKSRIVQFYPKLDFGGILSRNEFTVRGDIFDLDMNLIRESENVKVKGLIEYLDCDYNKIKNIKPKIEKVKTKVYVMIDKNTGYYKIGRSVNPSIREKTLQSEKPTIEMLFNHDAEVKDEKELHNMFSEKRIRGEWFDLNGSDLCKIKDYLS